MPVGITNSVVGIEAGDAKEPSALSEVETSYVECHRPKLLQRVRAVVVPDVAWPETLQRVLALAGEELNFSVCAFWRLTPDDSAMVCQSIWRSPNENGNLDDFVVFTKNLAFPCGFGLPGRVWQREETIVLEEIDADRNFVRGKPAQDAQLRTAVGAPIIRDGKVLGVLECIDHARGAASNTTLGCIDDMATVLADACPDH